MPDEITEMEITIGNARSNEAIVVRAIMEPENGPTATLDNIALKKIRGGSKKAILSNEDQDVPWKVIINLSDDSVQTQFRFNCVNTPIKQALKAQRFWDALSSGGHLTIELEKTDAQVVRANIAVGAVDPPDRQMIKLLEALATIQSKTEVTFTSPAVVSPSDANYIVTVAQIVSTGVATMVPPEMNFTVKEVKEIFPTLASGATMVLQQYIDEWVSIVLGKRVTLGPVFISCDTLHVSSEEREQAMKVIEGRSPDDVISVKVSPVQGSAIEAKFFTWLPESEAEEIRNTPIVRAASLKHLMKTLVDGSVDASGSFNVDEFIKLLAQAKTESTNEEIVISPLLLATEEDLVHSFKTILEGIEPEQRNILEQGSSKTAGYANEPTVF